MSNIDETINIGTSNNILPLPFPTITFTSFKYCLILVIVEKLFIIISHHMYAMPPYPYLSIDYPTVIIGNVLNNNNGKNCLELIKKNKNILFLDWIKHSDPLLESAYAASKIFVLPSLYETPGRAALEAGLCGSNISITPYGGTKEYFSNYVNYMNPYSITSIQKSIIKSINKPNSQKLSKHIKNNFLWGKIAEQTKKEYIKIISRGK